ncbi:MULTISPECIES: cytochrome P450 [Actinomadura]|uniref:Cytochrome P450 n=1 Tax=Actinomadura litoris TaxID=2678616 RepID=A0A7K1L214_9ACTN|nr:MULTISPECIES: cytochrome P450 [Actinomadura]MBT2206554.1 cytochrome P450 [Actinomadura sp. NEAU-AAG7]MUN38343.1 cytochrome P450 [Actinomadura litoris]
MSVPQIDFDPFAESGPAGRMHAMLDGLRERHEAFRSTGQQGFWVLTRHDDILAAFQNPETFSSRAIAVIDPDPAYQWIPVMLDPPLHTAWRRLLRPLFTPATAGAMRERITRHCAALIGDLAGRGSCDFVTDFARLFPTIIFLELVGLPTGRLKEFLAWEDAVLHPPPSGAGRAEALREVADCFTELIRDRRADPRDDLVSAATTFVLDGRPVTDAELLQLCVLLFLAGLDTVAAQLSYTFWHLATHEDDRARVAADPAVVPGAVEEFLRVYALPLPARRLTEDVDLHGCPMRAGEMVMLPISMATRDPRAFPSAASVDIGGPPAPHLAFGAGPHRCLGAHLARLELQVALTEWHARIPDYGIAPGARPTEHASLVLGLDALPLSWPPAR